MNQKDEKHATLKRYLLNYQAVILSETIADSEIRELKQSLTNRERNMLDCLIQSKGSIVSRENLCSRLWNDEPNNSHLSQISVLIKRIKMKLEIACFGPKMLQTIWGSGYRLAKGVFEKDFLEKV